MIERYARVRACVKNMNMRFSVWCRPITLKHADSKGCGVGVKKNCLISIMVFEKFV